jgi:hypothetical protein
MIEFIEARNFEREYYTHPKIKKKKKKKKRESTTEVNASHV